MRVVKTTRTGMVQQFSLWVRLVFVWIYARVFCEPKQIQNLKTSSHDEVFVYILESENKHDFLYLNYLCLKHSLPLAVASNGKSKRRFASLWQFFRSLFRGRPKKAKKKYFLSSCVQDHKPILLFLNTKNKKNSIEAILEDIQELRKNTPSLKIRFVTATIIWERRADNLKHTLFNEIYGTPTRPSSVRRLLSVMPSIHQLFFKIGVPLCLIHKEEHDRGLNSGTQLLQYLQKSIDQARETVLGPKLKPYQTLKKEILSSPAFIDELTKLSQETETNVEVLLQEAQKILSRTAAKFSFLVVKIVCTLLTPIWSLIYNGLYIDREKINEIRELSKKHRIIFAPSHKSHIDYLVLSYLLFQHGLMPPHIVAGENLNFRPIGSILRRGGAFFIKRSFKGEQLYSLCLQHYISKLIVEGYPLEFFIEGGRSRTGQVLQPKYGILRMIAKAAEDNPDLSIKFIPCAITYEKVIEDLSYQKEQKGEAKNKENISNLIKTTKVLISKYGQLYVSFSEAIDLKDYLSSPHESDQHQNQQIEKLGLDIIQQINRASTITISALLSAALLNVKDQPIEESKLFNDCSFILSILLERTTQLSPALKLGLASHRALIHESSTTNKALSLPVSPSKMDGIGNAIEDSLKEGLKLLEKNNNISRKKGQAQFIEIPNESRLQLAFYKNSLLSALIDEIYAAAAILAANPGEDMGELISRFNEITDIFSFEFTPTNTQSLEQTIERFIQRAWLSEALPININDSGVKHLRYLRRCLFPFVQAYLLTALALDKLKEASIEEEKLIDNLLKTMSIHEQKTLTEAHSKILFSHAIQKFTARNICKLSYQQSNKKSVRSLRMRGEFPRPIIVLLESLLKQ